MKRRILIAVVLSLGPIAFLVYWFAQQCDPINAVNFARIDIGMNRDEVIEILGDPGVDPTVQEELSGDWWSRAEVWSRPNRNTVRIVFRWDDGVLRVESKRCYFPSTWDRMKAWSTGEELWPDFWVPDRLPGGRSKVLEEAA